MESSGRTFRAYLTRASDRIRPAFEFVDRFYENHPKIAYHTTALASSFGIVGLLHQSPDQLEDILASGSEAVGKAVFHTDAGAMSTNFSDWVESKTGFPSGTAEYLLHVAGAYLMTGLEVKGLKIWRSRKNLPQPSYETLNETFVGGK